MIRVLNTVFHTDGWGNHRVLLAAGVHEENEATLRQVALGNGVQTDEPATMEGAGPIVVAAPAAAPEAAPAPAPAAPAPAPADAPAAASKAKKA